MYVACNHLRSSLWKPPLVANLQLVCCLQSVCILQHMQPSLLHVQLRGTVSMLCNHSRQEWRYNKCIYLHHISSYIIFATASGMLNMATRQECWSGTSTPLVLCPENMCLHHNSRVCPTNTIKTELVFQTSGYLNILIYLDSWLLFLWIPLWVQSGLRGHRHSQAIADCCWPCDTLHFGERPQQLYNTKASTDNLILQI